MSAATTPQRTTPTESGGPQPPGELCRDLAVAGDVDNLVDYLDVLTDWGYAKRLRYARELVNSQDSAREYARVPAAASDRGPFRRHRVEGSAFADPHVDIAGERATFNLEVGA